MTELKTISSCFSIQIGDYHRRICFIVKSWLQVEVARSSHLISDFNHDDDMDGDFGLMCQHKEM